MSVRDHHAAVPRGKHFPRLHEAIVEGCMVRRHAGGSFTVREIDRTARTVVLDSTGFGERRVSFATLDLDYGLVGGAA